MKALEKYKACKEVIAQHLEGYPIIDALSNLEFYTMGVIQKPVPGTRHALEFYEAGVPGLWAYYCGGGAAGWRAVAIIYAIVGLITNTISTFSVLPTIKSISSIFSKL